MSAQRFTPLTLEAMDPEQRKVAEGIIGGPRGGMRGPFNALLRAPELADHAQKLGAYVRFGSKLPEALKEMAILITGRHWTAQYEWYAHNQLAMKAGLNPAISAAIAEGKRPSAMSKEETVVYEFCTELLETKQISDATFTRTRDTFGERGLMDLVGAVGYYSLVSMCLNIDRYPLPEGVAPPLKPLK
jgi:4-carboxymuconolactone decarboxylase